MSLPPTKEVLHTCKIVNYFLSAIYFWQGGQIVGEGVAESGKGVGPRRVGEGGWGKVAGEGGREGGWGEALIEVLNKTGIVTFSLVIVKHFTRQNRSKWQGIPDLGGIPIK